MRAHLLLFMVLALASPSASLAGPASSPLPRSTLTTGSSSYGRILFDGRGFALYAFTRDPRGRSVCTGACAKAWPPFVVKTPTRAAAGVKATLLGTTKRADGKLQATYAGRPLYYYVGDRKPGQVLCQNVREFGGVWLVIRSTGALVR
jgi:predicted lipoprotein with Yx(FWY)xxD motif